MVISDLQYLESVESSTVIGGGKKYKPKHKKGGGLDFDFDLNIAVVNVIQIAKASGKNSTAANNAEVYIKQS